MLRARSPTAARCAGARAVVSAAASTKGIGVSAAAGTTARQVPVADPIGAAATGAVRGPRALVELAGSVAGTTPGTSAVRASDALIELASVAGTAPRTNPGAGTIAGAGSTAYRTTTGAGAASGPVTHAGAL